MPDVEPPLTASSQKSEKSEKADDDKQSIKSGKSPAGSRAGSAKSGRSARSAASTTKTKSGAASPALSLRDDDPIGDMRNMRRIIAEDPEWSLATVPLLAEMCIKHVVGNFECKYMMYMYHALLNSFPGTSDMIVVLMCLL
jgi:hypothetical protein